MDEVVAPLLHNREPAALVESVELPQLFTTVTTGAEGVVLGADIPLPAVLLQPLLPFAITVYVAALLTVMDAVVALLLHNTLPPDGIVVESVDVPLQLFTTVTTGVEGTAFGAVIPLPFALVHPFMVVFTV